MTPLIAPGGVHHFLQSGTTLRLFLQSGNTLRLFHQRTCALPLFISLNSAVHALGMQTVILEAADASDDAGAEEVAAAVPVGLLSYTSVHKEPGSPRRAARAAATHYRASGDWFVNFTGSITVYNTRLVTSALLQFDGGATAALHYLKQPGAFPMRKAPQPIRRWKPEQTAQMVQDILRLQTCRRGKR